MNKEEFDDYLHTQRDEILKFKWIRSEEEGHDIGRNKAAGEWTANFAEKFRDYWECQHCPYWFFCPYKEDGEDW